MLDARGVQFQRLYCEGVNRPHCSASDGLNNRPILYTLCTKPSHSPLSVAGCWWYRRCRRLPGSIHRGSRRRGTPRSSAWRALAGDEDTSREVYVAGPEAAAKETRLGI